jgi:hypothetical protein
MAKASGTMNSRLSSGLSCMAVNSQKEPKAAPIRVSPVARFMMRATPYCRVRPIAIRA